MSENCLIPTVGGTPDPMMHAINEHRPATVWFIYTEDSKKVAEDIIAIIPEIYSDWSYPGFVESEIN